ncbi:MAG: DUF4097 family beta strand repeat protein, partial [Anaerolineales bacterium]|nr:DUF4097 family beta strand repeat protein [Anaerolineales bacterium]
MKQQFPTTKAPHLIIEDCKGALTIRPHDHNMVVVSSPQAEVVPSETDDSITITSQAPLAIYAPHQTAVLIRNVYGTAVVKGIHNDVTIENARGNLTCRNVGTVNIKAITGSLAIREVDHTVTIGNASGDVSVRNSQDVRVEHIRGDFIARNVQGAVHVAHSDGDLVLRNISGDVWVDYCDRDLSLRNVAGQVQVRDVQGDIRLRESLPPGEHQLNAQGDIVVRWPTTAALNLQATGRTVQNHLPLTDWPTGTPDKMSDDELKKIEALKMEEKSAGEHGRVYLRGRLGDGDCNLTLHSQSDIILRPLHSTSGDSHEDSEFNFDMDFEMDFGFAQTLERLGEQMAGLGETIAAEVTSHMSNLTSELEGELGSKYADQMASKAERAVERAMRKTEEALKRMQRQAAYAPVPPTPPPPPMPTKPTPKAATPNS